MYEVSCRIPLVAGALVLLVGCYSNNGGLIDLDGGIGGPFPPGSGPDGGFAGGDGDGGSAGSDGSGGGGTGAGGSGADSGSGGTAGKPLTGKWQPPVVIDSHEGTGLNPHVSIGANGEAVSVWVQSFEGEHKVWANRYAAQEWEGDLPIGSTDGLVSDPTQTSQPYVVVDPNGVATAAWADFDDPVVRGLVSRRHVPPDGWEDPPGIIYDGASTAGDARLAVDASGRVMAVFAAGRAWANYFQPGGTWGGAETIDDVSYQPPGVQVALEPGGDGWAIWAQGPPGAHNIVGASFIPGRGWGEAANVENGTFGNAAKPQLAVSANGNALFIWQRTSGLQLHVWSNGWDASENELTDPVRVDSAGTAYALAAPAVASDPQGNGTAVWIQKAQVSGTPLQVAASRYAPGSGWSTTPEVLAEGAITSDPRVAMDSQGNAVVVYTQRVAGETWADAWARTYSAGAWGPAVRLGRDGGTGIIGDAFQPSVAMDPSGNAVVVWREFSDIWAATFE